MSHPLSHPIDCVTNLNDAILAYLKLILVRMMSACYPINCTWVQAVCVGKDKENEH